MPNEIEAKFRIEDFAPVHDRLRQHRAEPCGTVMETNRYFDWPDSRLREGDCGLRIRSLQPLDSLGESHCPTLPAVLTYKGPRQQSEMKVREEIELGLDDAQAGLAVLAALGMKVVLTFQKRRETWKLAGCEVVLDELPQLGKFLEIEGPDEPTVNRVRAMLGLKDCPIERQPYVALLLDELRRSGNQQIDVRF